MFHSRSMDGSAFHPCSSSICVRQNSCRFAPKRTGQFSSDTARSRGAPDPQNPGTMPDEWMPAWSSSPCTAKEGGPKPFEPNFTGVLRVLFIGPKKAAGDLFFLPGHGHGPGGFHGRRVKEGSPVTGKDRLREWLQRT